MFVQKLAPSIYHREIRCNEIEFSVVTSDSVDEFLQFSPSFFSPLSSRFALSHGIRIQQRLQELGVAVEGSKTWENSEEPAIFLGR